MKNVLLSVGAAAALAVGGSIPAAGAASAASGSCSGSLIWHGQAKDQGHVVGELDVYWNGSTGRNCARFNRLGGEFGDVGQRRFTQVDIYTCSTKSCATYSQHQADHDLYAYYAGPVSVPARNKCIYASGAVYLHGAWHPVATGTIGCS